MAKKRTLKRRADAPVNASKKRTLKRPSPAKELAQIERLLGEDFDSLAQARRALNKESKPVKQSSPKSSKKSIPKRITPAPTQQQETPVPLRKPYEFDNSQRAYTVRDLRRGEKQEIIKWLQDYNATRRIQALKKPGEFWAAEIPYRVNDKRTGVKTSGIAKTYNIYSDVFALFGTLSGYATRSKNKERKSDEAIKRWLNSIKIVRFKGSDSSYKHHNKPKGNGR